MKLKYLQGGTFVPPFAVYLPFMVPSAEELTTTKSSKKSDDGMDMKDVYGLLKDLDGLPGDVGAAAGALDTLFKNIEMKLSSPEAGLFGGTSSIASEYLQILRLTNDIKFQRAQYDKARDTAIANGGINEYAIDSMGRVLTLTEEGFEWTTPEEIWKHPELYRALTNAELLQYRANGIGGLSFDSASLSTVSNSVGMANITKMITDSLSNLGTRTLTNQGYGAVQAKQVLNGAKILQEAAASGSDLTLDGLYKAEKITKDLLGQVELALNYIYHTLPENAKSLLKMKSGGTREGLKELLSSLVMSKTSSEVSFDVDYLDNLNLDGTRKSTKTADEENNPALMLQLDRGAIVDTRINAGTADNLIVRATQLGNLDKEGNPLGLITVADFFNKSVFAGLGDESQVSMGDQVLSESSLNNVIITNNRVTKMYLPVDQKKLADGVIAPDTEYLAKMEKVWQKAREQGIIITNNLTKEDKARINEICRTEQISPFYGSDGNINESIYKPFLTFNAVAAKEAFSTDVSLNDSFRSVRDKNLLLNYWTMLKGKDAEADPKSGWWEWDFDEVFEGQVYIPMSTNPAYGLTSGGSKPSTSEFYKAQEAYLAEQRASTAQHQGAL